MQRHTKKVTLGKERIGQIRAFIREARTDGLNREKRRAKAEAIQAITTLGRKVQKIDLEKVNKTRFKNATSLPEFSEHAASILVSIPNEKIRNTIREFLTHQYAEHYNLETRQVASANIFLPWMPTTKSKPTVTVKKGEFLPTLLLTAATEATQMLKAQ